MPLNYYALLGNPISHSLSPGIHQLFAQQTHQQLSYEAKLVDSNDLEQAITTFPGQGLNLTAPFKLQALNYVHTLSPTATQIQAINTIKYLPDGSRYGDNTDAAGFLTDIKINQGINLQDQRILILGAGGAARAIAYALQSEKTAPPYISNRTQAKADILATAFNLITAIPRQVDIIINTTSTFDPNLLNLSLAPTTYCYDLNYSLTPTPFLKWAQQHGVKQYSDGLGMLIEQAANAFYLWRGLKPDTLPVLAIYRSRQSLPEIPSFT